MNKEQLITLLASIVHPETGKNIVESDLVSMAELEGGKIVINLMMAKPRDPFAMKIKNRIVSTDTSALSANSACEMHSLFRSLLMLPAIISYNFSPLLIAFLSDYDSISENSTSLE